MGVPPGGAGLRAALSLGLWRDMAAADGAAVEISSGLSREIMCTPGSWSGLFECSLLMAEDIRCWLEAR